LPECLGDLAEWRCKVLGLYDRTPERNKCALDGWWDFVVDSAETGEEVGYYQQFPDELCTRITVPGVWETRFGLEDYQGVAWYRKVFKPGFTGRCLLTFGAVAYKAKVWLNGEYLGAHEGDFTAFKFVASLREGENAVVVRVDNRHTDQSLPKEVVDWYPYGGITRSVICEQIGDVYIDHVHLVARLDGHVEAKVTARNAGDSDARLPVSIAIDGGVVGQGIVSVGGRSEQIHAMSVTVTEPEPWAPATPRLYEAQVRLGEDLFVERFGFREITTDGHRLLLNGEPIFVRGVNRHEDHPDWGFALPDRVMQRDVEIIESLNCNAIRGSHYPNHPTFLDLCDEEGLLFFAEVPGWQYSAYQLSHKPTADLLATTLREMITQQCNHPCIIIWSLHNECDTDVFREDDLDVRSEFERLFALARELDDTRLVTYASHRYWHDKHFDLADVVCLNQYIGWYVDELEGADLAAYLDRMVEMVPDKPILITEFGAGGLYGYHSIARRKWSEEHQAEHIVRQIEQMLENEHVAGCYIWQYCDILSNPARAIRRPRSLNNKGLVDEYRRPKMAYCWVRDAYERLADQEDMG